MANLHRINEFHDVYSAEFSSFNEKLYALGKFFLLSYRRFDASGKVFYVSLDKSWLHTSIEEGFITTSLSQDRINSLELNVPKIFFWKSNIYQKDLAYQALYDANIWNGVTVYYRNKKYIELWGFATTRDNLSFQEFFVQNQNLMNVYMLHFKENYRDVIFPQNASSLLFDTNIIIPVASHNNFQIQEFIKNNPISKIHLDGHLNTISTKQAICLSLYTQGWSMKAIAELLGLSVRTIECNIYNGQVKLNCTQRAQTSRVLQSALPIGFHDLINSYIK